MNARTPPQIDHATGDKVCAKCWADISRMHRLAVFCSYECRNRAKARRQRDRMKESR